MKNPAKCLILICLLVLNFTNCKKSSNTPDPVIPDTTKPTITIVKPTAGQIFIVGSSITFQATFADNIKLGSYNIAITKVITSGFILKNVPTAVAWSYTKSTTNFTSEKQQDIDVSDINIPLLIGNSPVLTGKYNFTVNCVDASNNSYAETREIIIN
jgi:hypothetical protein